MPRKSARDDLLDRRQAAERLGLSLATFEKRRERSRTGEGPPVPEPDLIKARSPLWHARTIDRYALALKPRRREAEDAEADAAATA